MLKDEIPYNPAVAQGGDPRLNATAHGLRQLLPRGQRRSGAQPRLAEDLGGRGRLRRPSSASSEADAPRRRRGGGQGRVRPTRRPSPRRCSRSSAAASPATRPSAPRTEAGDAAALGWLVALLAGRGARLLVADAAARPAGGRAGGAAGGRRGARRDLVLGRRLRLLPCRGEGRRRGPAEARRRAGAENRRSATSSSPNISSDRSDGIGGWSAGDFANAMLRGVSPDGQHLYPAFPYASYARMKPEDVADLWAYLATLPAVAGAAAAARRCAFRSTSAAGVGLWKLAFLTHRRPPSTLDGADPAVARGPVPGRGAGALRRVPHAAQLRGRARRRPLARRGAGTRRARARCPNITGGEGGIGDWSAEDIAYFFETGFTPDFDSVGGSMVEVQENLAMLAGDDRAAIAAYLKAVPPQASATDAAAA